MKYVLTGSLGNINKPLARQLIAAGHTVTIISSNPQRQAAINQLGAEAAIGSVEDTAFLTKTFTGADAVFTLIPPIYEVADWKGYIHGIGKNFAEVIKTSGVKKVVNLSSIGAHLPEGVGPVTGLHYAELELNKLDGVDIKHLRPAFFYTNFLANIGMIKHAGIYGNNFSADQKLILTHPNDIAEVAAEELLKLDFIGKSVRYIASDERDSKEITNALGDAIGQPNLPYVPFTDEQNLEGMLQAGLPKEIAVNYVEMGQAARTGVMFEDYKKHPVTLQKTKLEDFAKEFAVAYNA